MKILSTPPSKSIAFEDFKAERGNEINRIWNENKGLHLIIKYFSLTYYSISNKYIRHINKQTSSIQRHGT
jgi:hypothetical protein